MPSRVSRSRTAVLYFVIKGNLWWKYTFLQMVTIVVLHHKHMKLAKTFILHAIACSVRMRKGLNQSICRMKEQKTRLQCLASVMPKFVMPSGTKKRKVSDAKRKNLAALAKTPRLNRFFSSSTFKQQRLSSGISQSTWKCRLKSRHKLRSTFHTQRDWPYWHVIFPVFWFVITGFCLLFGWILFLAESLSRLWNIFLCKQAL